MCNNYQNGVREKIVYRDRVVEKKVTKRIFIADPGNSGELEKLRAQVEILRKENRKLSRNRQRRLQSQPPLLRTRLTKRMDKIRLQQRLSAAKHNAAICRLKVQIIDPNLIQKFLH